MAGRYFLICSLLEKCGFFFKNSRFFRVDMAGLGKYHIGGYGRIGVYRVKQNSMVHTYAISRRGSQVSCFFLLDLSAES